MAKMPKAVREYFKKEGKRGGLLGGPARMKKLTAEQRRELARKAAKARWSKEKEDGTR